MDNEETLREALIDLARSREQEARQRIESEGLLQGLQVLTGPTDSGVMFSRLLEVMRGVLHFEQACVLIGQADGSLRPIATTGDQFEDTTWVSDKLFRRVLNGKPTAAFDVTTIPEWRDQPASTRRGVTSALHAPLRGGEAPALLLCTHSRRAFFTREHIQLAERFALLAAQALMNAEASKLAFRQQLLEREKTAMEERSRLLQAARDEALAASRIKSDFLANMSHEIRTPMNAIIGMSHLALECGLQGQARDYVDKVHQSAKSLLGVINDILDFSKIEAGKLAIETVPFRLADLFDELSAVLTLPAQNKDVALRFELAPELPEHLLGDPLRTNQVLLNLANNAVKFTPQGEVTISAAPIHATDTDVDIRLSVKDTGIGIPPEQRDNIFRTFTQADPSTTRKYGGTGLGLAISRRLVEMMNGRIWVDSEPGRGSTFHVELRFGVTDAAVAVAVESETGDYEHAVARLRGARILVVEDNAFNQEIALALLQAKGLQVELAGDGRQAIEKIRQAAFDGVLMDCQMPVMDGYTATRLIRDEPAYRALPIIAMTANVLREDVDRAMTAGMNDLIGKPIDVRDMFVVMARWIRPAIDDPPAPRRADPRPHSAGGLTLPGLDTDDGIRRVGGDVVTYLSMLRKFGQNQADAPQRANQALLAGDRQEAERRLHTLKGTAGSIGATDLATLAAAAETTVRSGAATLDDLPELERALVAVLEVIDRYAVDTRQTTDAPSDGQRDELVDRLHGQLADYDTAAANTLARLMAMPTDPATADMLAQVRIALERYDFVAAKTALAPLRDTV